MPNVPKTKHRSVRVSYADWADLLSAAKTQGKDRAAVLNDFIAWYLHRPGAKTVQRPKPDTWTPVTCGASATFWPDVEACEAVCALPPHDGTVHKDETLGEWDENDLPTWPAAGSEPKEAQR